MDDSTKDLIPRSAVKYCLRKETVSTNPDEYSSHEKFIQFMDDPEVAEFGRWMHSNGFNCALTAIKCDLDMIPSVPEPERKKGHWVEIGDEPYGEWECDVCGFVIDGSGCIDPEEYRDVYKFCPRCGADMRGGQD